MTLHTVPIRRAGNRKTLFMGGDRELVMSSMVLAFTLVFSVQRIDAMVVGVLLWFGALQGLRWMAKSDPAMRQVYMRHRIYKRYYPARSTPYRINTTSQGNQYK
ncbi:conjugal transfer protein TrbD [Pseudomonas sp. PDM20]|uniref:conjugal transfer protein TrbD n=1 Tax=Pseudomonas sp. PDM20 TaxID=2769254 RepID=UPI00177C7503|nr:conjugal transfer protein TrbD [Pseudomonas sp. PDM20]MBD9686860.1 VirB3 family type IV secretion system protein [Pseudomonas sp. PDM20]